jgi:hypothetical protein
MPSPHPILDQVLSGSTEIPHRFVCFRRRAHFGQDPGTQALGNLARIPPVSLDPLPRLDRRQ